MNTASNLAHSFSSLFVAESDRWLTCLCSYLNSHSRPQDLLSITRSSLPPATLAYLYSSTSPSTGHPDLDHIVECAEWCLVIIAWSVGLSSPSISARTLDRVSFALLNIDGDGEGLRGESLGEILYRWRWACNRYIQTRMVN